MYKVEFKTPRMSCMTQLCIGRGIITGREALEEIHPFIVTTRTLLPSILPLAQSHPVFFLPEGEEAKTRKAKEGLEDALFQAGCTRSSSLVAIGGGAVLDVAGFVAATYCRGVSFFSYPTTLLSMTDAAIGGKTGINLSHAKNWMGAFYVPQKIGIDLAFLDTLPSREMALGIVETIKHAALGDIAFFSFLEEHLEELIEKKGAIEMMVIESCKIKLKYVRQDFFERKGIRTALNFGHTIAHAIETDSLYVLEHGRAVAVGMLVEGAMACELGYLKKDVFLRLASLLRRLRLFPPFPPMPPLELLQKDKKGFFFVVLEAIGKVSSRMAPLSEKLIKKGWDDAMRAA